MAPAGPHNTPNPETLALLAVPGSSLNGVCDVDDQ